MPGNQVRIATQVTGVTKASSDLDKLKDKFTKLQKNTGKGLLTGFAAGAALGLATNAVSNFASALGDATQAAMDDEASQTRLRASLSANVNAWDGNTDAIEANITAAQRLGFDDETLRDSLTVLVGATHDVTKAQEIMATAMDLARFKGIDLRTASEALIKVEGGHYRALAQLGIKLKEGATAQDALAAVQKVAKGQAESYADTNSGKLLVSQVKVNEAMEKAGYKIMPAVAEAAAFLARVIEDLSTVASNFEPVWVGVGKANEEMIQQIKEMDPEFQKVEHGLLKVDHAAYEATKQLKRMSSGAESVTKSVDEMTDALVDDAERMMDDFFGPIHAEWDRHDARIKLAADIEALATAKTKKAHKEAARAIIDDLEDQGGALEQLGEDHELSQEEVAKYKRDVTKAYKALGRDVPQELQRIINKLEVLAGFSGGAININVEAHVQRGKSQIKATGGMAGGSTLVGERGPEVVDLPSGSFVHPSGQGSASAGTTINVYPQGRWDVDSVTSAAQAMRRLESIAHTPNATGIIASG